MRRLSLRSALVIAGLFAVSAAALRTHLVAEAQRRGREWVIDQRGHIVWSRGGHGGRVPQRSWPMFGADWFDTVDAVVLDNQTVTDLTPLLGLRELQEFAIMIDIDPDLDFSPLAELPKLRRIQLQYTGLDAKGLKKLQTLLPGVSIECPDCH